MALLTRTASLTPLISAFSVFLLYLHCISFLPTSHASSVARNHLQYIQYIDNPVIHTPRGRIDHLSEFNLEFELPQGNQAVRLSLEPNHDIIPHGAWINYLSDDGSIAWSEPIEKESHKVFKGTTRVYDEIEDTWWDAGWARITVHRDGFRPIFEGAFLVNGDSHHVQLQSSYMRTRHALDPYLDNFDDESMLVFRDSDVAPRSLDTRSIDTGCAANQLDFNSRSDHPVFASMLKRSEKAWGATPMTSLFRKRQIDNQGSGNTGGVNLASTIGQANGCPSTRRVALMGVAADCNFRQRFNSTESARSMVIQTVNSASSVWEDTFNISLGLQNLTIMAESCPGSVQESTRWNQDCSADGVDINARLNYFSQWRGTLGDQNAYWSLFTNCATGADVGLAWLGQACVHNAFASNTSTGGTEYVSGTNVVVLTSTDWQILAHETGHTFGAVHDCTSQTCAQSSVVDSQQCCPLSTSTCSANNQYIMNPYVASGITQFSQCTLGNICSAILRNSVNTTCLSPNTQVPTVTGSQCGNGIVEIGEQCDCGGPEGCGDDTCCDPTTCKFINGAVCDDANEDCCTSCQFTRSGSVCRASTGECDPAEVCTGSSGTCPANTLAPDGQACHLSNSTNTDLACASGQCTSRNMQCQTAMGSYEASGSFGHSIGSPNDTFACNQNDCQLTCSSPSFGSNTCVDFNSYLLDGTPCGGGGSCTNGQCNGSSTSREIESWIDSHKGLVIGVAVPVGILLLATLFMCLYGCCCGRRKKQRQQQQQQGRKLKYLNTEPPSPAYDGAAPYYNQQAYTGWYAPHPHAHFPPPPPPPPPHAVPVQQRSSSVNLGPPYPPLPQQQQRSASVNFMPIPFPPAAANANARNGSGYGQTSHWDWIHGRQRLAPQGAPTQPSQASAAPEREREQEHEASHHYYEQDPDSAPVSPIHTTGPPQTNWLYGSGILGAHGGHYDGRGGNSTPLPPYQTHAPSYNGPPPNAENGRTRYA